jgi:hypothetical protein
MNDKDKKEFHNWTQQRMLLGKACLQQKSQYCLEALHGDANDCVKCWKENKENKE